MEVVRISGSEGKNASRMVRMAMSRKIQEENEMGARITANSLYPKG